MKITDVKVHALKPWGELKNHAKWKPRKNIYNLVRVYTDAGIDGDMITQLTGAHPLALESCIDNIKSVVIGKDPLDRERIYYELNFTGSFFKVNKYFNSAIDCALWDIAGKAAGLPVYKLMGGFRDKLRAYASTLSYQTIDEYVALGRECEKLGFTALKLHGFANYKEDIGLCEAMRAEFPNMDLMLDSLCEYDRVGALKVGRVLDKLGFYWFESPLREEDVEGHILLRQKLDIPIAGTELNMIGFLDFPEYITRGAVDIVRTFGDYIGGITPMQKAAHLCEAFHLKMEPHSFGNTLVQAAHFHVMLSMRNCDFFESPVPEGVFDEGMKDVIKIDQEGNVHAPKKPGLGYDLDWNYIDNQTERVF